MKRPPWNARRRIVHGTLLFCAGMVSWLIWKGEDTNLAAAVATACFCLAGSVIGAYVFGAAWDDKNVMQSMGAQAYQEEEPLP